MQACSRCRQVFYCSKEHKQQDWKLKHKNECQSYKIIVKDKLKFEANLKAIDAAGLRTSSQLLKLAIIIN